MLTKRGEYWYATAQSDIADEVRRFSRLNGYEAEHFADAVCVCGARSFRLATDEEEGVAVRACASCHREHPVGDGAEYLDDAELEQRACACDAEAFEITVGLSLYSGSDSVRWLYLGCRCTACGLTGVYGDWKNEFDDYRALLAKV